jgi:hypothetical protein
MTQTTQTIQTSQTIIKLSTWCAVLWKNAEGWNRAIGYAVKCSCGHGDRAALEQSSNFHLVLSEPRKSIQCIQRDCLIVLEYLPSA